jgi:hypothetical protein
MTITQSRRLGVDVQVAGSKVEVPRNGCIHVDATNSGSKLINGGQSSSGSRAGRATPGRSSRAGRCRATGTSHLGFLFFYKEGHLFSLFFIIVVVIVLVVVVVVVIAVVVVVVIVVVIVVVVVVVIVVVVVVVVVVVIVIVVVFVPRLFT